MSRSGRMNRPEFDPTCEFVANTPRGGKVKIGGREYLHGEQVDKLDVDPRRLRQLYAQRTIRLADGQEPKRPASKPLAIGPTDLFNPGSCGHELPRAEKPVPQPKRRVQRVRSKRYAAA